MRTTQITCDLCQKDADTIYIKRADGGKWFGTDTVAVVSIASAFGQVDLCVPCLKERLDAVS